MASKVTWFGRARYFLRSHIVHGPVRVVLQNLFTRFQSLFIQPTLLPYFISYFPFKKNHYSYLLPKNPPAPPGRDANGLPYPPEHLWLGYGRTIEEWLESGVRHVTKMREILATAGYHFESGDRVLELGVAGSRMLRNLVDVADRCEIWGTDLSGEHIMWSKQYLSPPFHYCITTTTPHLPFADNYFSLIYAGSVFTHIDDMTDTWLMELRRIMKTGGYAYLTIHDQHTIRVLSEQRNLDLSKTLYCREKYFKPNADGSANYGMFTIGRYMRSQVFFDTDYFTSMVKDFFDVVSVTPEAYGFQTAVLLRKKA